MRLPIAAIVVLLTATVARAADPYSPLANPTPVASLDADWRDTARNLDVPIKLYFPKNIADAKAPLPLILFSHGLGGSRDGYAIWAETWASHGYLVLLPTHLGSDTSVLTGASGAGAAGALQTLAKAASAENAFRRCADISFCIDQVEKINAGTLTGPGADTLAPFKNKIDLHHLGMSGHSFGAQTTLSIAGETYQALGRSKSFADPRITAAVAMSPQPSKATPQNIAFGSIKIPVLHLTGTADDSPLGDVAAAERRIPFDNSTAPGTTLIIFKNAVHMTFAPVKPNAPGARLRQLRAANAPAALTPQQEAALDTLIEQATTAFWDATLKSDSAATAWLSTDLPPLITPVGTLETKKSPTLLP